MKVSESSIQLYSEHKSIEQHKVQESLSVWGAEGKALLNKDDRIPAKAKEEFLEQADTVHLSNQARIGRPQRADAVPVADDMRDIADLNITILRSMIERLTGKVIDIKMPQDVTSQQPVNPESSGSNSVAVQQLQEGGGEGFGLEYDYYESHYEYESTSFAAEGIILTEDGSEIDFDIQLNMTREFMSEQSISIKAGEALKDPLVVNFSGKATELSQTSFEFDLDLDGRDDQISFVNPGSGFLALDKNGDNAINDGSELFGPKTGEGFAELAEYDTDGNLWIDENDSIFEHLRIWVKNEAGQSQLFSLGEKGIGAIYLNHIETPFALKNSENDLLGQVRDTGLFIKEDGTTGTVQQIDLAV